MINFLIACDDKDLILGSYFAKCRDKLCDFLNEYNFEKTLVEISGKKCNVVNIDLNLDALTNNKFIFIAFSHGNYCSLLVDKEEYVSCSHNASKFGNALFYTNACSSGKGLGLQLIDQGCAVFIGYSEDINVSLNHLDVFANCDNACLYFFFGEEITIFEAFQKTKRHFTNRANKLEPFDRAELIYARDALVFHGNKNLSKRDFFSSNQK